MKILIVSQYYPPENALIAPTLARSLATMGHGVRVLTGFPNYPEGAIFDGYQQRWRQREMDGPIEVLRVPLWPDHSQNAVLRALNYSSFALSSTTARRFAREVDVIYVYATQMTPALGPWLWRMLGGAPYVLHVQDLWPDSITGSSLVKSGAQGKIVNALTQPWLHSTYRNAAAVIGIAPTMVDTLIKRGAPSERTHLVYNWATENAHSGSSTTTRLSDSEDIKVRILYAGNVGDMQDLERVVEAAHRARDAGVALKIVGDGVALPRIRRMVDILGAENVSLVGRVSRDEIKSYYADSDFALVTLKNLPNFRGTIPSKFQAALAHGVPVITNVQGDVRNMVEDMSIGLTTDTESVPAMEQAFRTAASMLKSHRMDMATRAKACYESHFSQTAGVLAIEQILQEIAGREGI